MCKGAINFSSDNEYYTPKSVVSRFGSFDYDPATTSEKAKDLGIPNFDTIESDGLFRDWTQFKRIWVNPPFTHKHLFLEKAVNTFMQVKNEIFFLCPIEFLTTKRFCEQIKIMGGGIRLYLFNGRIKFESGRGRNEKSPAFGSVIFKLQERNEIEFMDL